MSGGSYDYVEYKLRNLAERLMLNSLDDSRYSRLKRILAERFEALAKVMHEIEWADSGDTDPEQAVTAIVRYLDDFCSGSKLQEDAACWRNLQKALKEH